MKLGIGERIREIRVDRSLPRSVIAAAFGVKSLTTVDNYEDETRYPDAKAIASFCKTLSVDPAWLLLGSHKNGLPSGQIEAAIIRILDGLTISEATAALFATQDLISSTHTVSAEAALK